MNREEFLEEEVRFLTEELFESYGDSKSKQELKIELSEEVSEIVIYFIAIFFSFSAYTFLKMFEVC